MSNGNPLFEEMPEHDWPQDGWHEVNFYAAICGVTRENFLRAMRKLGVPTVSLFQGYVLVHARAITDYGRGSDGGDE